MFFAFDGVDGVGKTTQINLFADWLRQQGKDVVTCRDPGTTRLGEELRKLLLEHRDLAIDRRAEMLIYMAARAQMVEEIIRPALMAGKSVVSDRFLLANVVYQGHAGGLDIETLWQVGKVAIAGVEPSLVFVLDMPLEAANARRGREPDRMEAQGNSFLQRVRDGFLAEARRDPQHIRVIDASRDITAIQNDIRTIAEPLLRGSP